MCVKNRTAFVFLVLALFTITACSGWNAPSGGLKTGGGGFQAEVSSDMNGRVSNVGPNTPAHVPTGPGSGVVRNGAQDASYFRHLIEAGEVPLPDEITVEGVFAEVSTHLPSPHRDRALSLHTLLGVSVDPRDQSPAAVLQLGMNSHLDFSGLPRLPVNLAVVIDKSGSMNDDNKMTFVKDGLRLMLESLGPQDRLSIVTYDSRARVLMPSTPVKNRKTIAAVIDSIYPGGATNIHDGLVAGYQQLQAHYDEGAVNRLMLLSDGVPTTGPTEPEAILTAAVAFEDHNITVSTIGVGTDFNHPLMLQLAQQGGGNFYFLKDYNKITTVFRDELETALTPIAEDVELTVAFDERVSLIASHGLPMGLNEDGQPHIYIPTMYLSRRNGIMLLELELGDLLDLRDDAPIGTATLEYTLLTTGERERATYPIDLPRATRNGRETVFFEHPAIRRNFDLLMAIYSLQDICDAFHHGDFGAARGFAHNLVGFLTRESRELEDTALTHELETAHRLLSIMR